MVGLDDGEHGEQVDGAGHGGELRAVVCREQLAQQKEGQASETEREAQHEHHQARDGQVTGRSTWMV